MSHRPIRRAEGFSLLELITVLGITGVVLAIAAPMTKNLLNNFGISGDAHGLNSAVSLTRMQAATNFTQTRLYLDLSVNAYHTEIYQKTGVPGWVQSGGTTYLSTGTESYGFGVVSSPPPNAQAAIGLASPCLNAGNNPIGSTACIVFNSRGIPIDSTGAPTAANALYLTDGTAVYGVTVSVTSVIRLWVTNMQATPLWIQQ